jgi:predicted peroxiredoxin
MAAFLYVVTSSTEDPGRAVTALEAALAASEAGHDVSLWLSGEGVRLGVRGVAETLREPGARSAAEIVSALAGRGAVLHCSRPCFERRSFARDALRPGARVSEASELASLLASGRLPVTL